MGYPAPQVTELSLDADRLILNGDSVKVCFIYAANDSASQQTVLITDNASSPETKFTIPLSPNEKIHLDFQYIADFGVRVPSVGDADVKVTIGHTSQGV